MINYNFIGWDYFWFLLIYFIYVENKNFVFFCNYVDEYRIFVNL